MKILPETLESVIWVLTKSLAHVERPDAPNTELWRAANKTMQNGRRHQAFSIMSFRMSYSIGLPHRSQKQNTTLKR